MTQTGMVAVRRVPTGVPCMKILQLRKNPMQHSPPQKHRKVARFYSRGLGPPRLEPHVLPTNALGPCTRPTRPSPSFSRTQQPNHFFALSIRAIRTVHHALQRLIAVRSPLRRSSFFPLCFLANIYQHGSLHTSPSPCSSPSRSHLQQWRSPVRRRRHRRRRRRFLCRYVLTLPLLLLVARISAAQSLNIWFLLHFNFVGVLHSNPGGRILQI
jgi:hypothetical protein